MTTRTYDTEGDVLLFQTVDDGEILVEEGVTKLSSGLETAVYLSLFGGNEEDDGSENSTQQWWGNADELDANSYRSLTQYSLITIPPSTGNLIRIQDAVEQDLQWLLDEGVASSVNVLVTIPGLNKVQIEAEIMAEGNPSSFKFFENWKAAV